MESSPPPPQFPVVEAANRIGLRMLLAGCLLGILAVGINSLHVIHLTKLAALNALIIAPGAVLVAGAVATIAARLLFVMVSRGRYLGTLEEISKQPSNGTWIQAMIFNSVAISAMVVAFAGGFLIGCSNSLLLTGYLWVITGGGPG